MSATAKGWGQWNLAALILISLRVPSRSSMYNGQVCRRCIPVQFVKGKVRRRWNAINCSVCQLVRCNSPLWGFGSFNWTNWKTLTPGIVTVSYKILIRIVARKSLSLFRSIRKSTLFQDREISKKTKHSLHEEPTRFPRDDTKDTFEEGKRRKVFWFVVTDIISNFLNAYQRLRDEEEEVGLRTMISRTCN